MDGAMSIWVGFDPRPTETQGYAVARASIRRTLTVPVPVCGLRLSTLQAMGMYYRPTEIRDGRLWDVISGAPMATEFAISRFLVPHMAHGGWALFVDADVMARESLLRLFELADKRYAVMCVKHDHQPTSAIKMDGQVQTSYERKNWSSVMLWNVAHPANRALTVGAVNRERGLWLHQLSWLDDSQIGELAPEWNHLVGERPANPEAKLVHFTAGLPNQTGYENCEFADEWRAELWRWAA